MVAARGREEKYWKGIMARGGGEGEWAYMGQGPAGVEKGSTMKKSLAVLGSKNGKAGGSRYKKKRDGGGVCIHMMKGPLDNKNIVTNKAKNMYLCLANSTRKNEDCRRKCCQNAATTKKKTSTMFSLFYIKCQSQT